jgi:hypothetical protein
MAKKGAIMAVGKYYKYKCKKCVVTLLLNLNLTSLFRHLVQNVEVKLR